LGGILSLCEWGGFYALTYLLGVHYIVSSIVMFVLLSLLGMVVYRKYVFGTSHLHPRNEILATYIINTIGLCLNTALLWILVEFLHIEALGAKIIASFFVAFFGFFARRKFVYGGRKMNEKSN
ncbi:GtrA family protein, partial [Helicobacter sp. MIT 99-10781]|uniref:GtrA family protein n=1 Tax=Helicobacter sp. MIT 99-10781 TaxID=1332285 RepID=UPI000E37CB7D